MSADDLDLGMLTTLDALLSEGSVTLAARRVGLSTPAMSHALARLRVDLGDPLLVRSGRGMVLTPRAEALKPRVHALVVEARATLGPERPFEAATVDRTFVVLATDYVLTLLGATVDRLASDEAPFVGLRVVPNGLDDPERLRSGEADLAIGIYGALPPELQSRRLLTDRLVCVVRRGHPEVARRLSRAQFVRLSHIQVAPRGTPGGYVDDVLREQGSSRRVARAVPYFLTALELAATTNHLLVVPERIATRRAASLGLDVHEVPFDLRPYALSLVWHPRFERDAAHRFARELFTRAAAAEASGTHARARARLDPSDPSTGEKRRRPRRRASSL